jgi:endonuclease/exonuclease/phosphatase family metal-dependent hydrolase
MSRRVETLLRVATYNVRACRGIDGQRSEKRIAEVIALLNVDVIGLQELDLNRRRSAEVDQATRIAEELGWRHVFHPALRIGDEQYGDAVLSPHPMRLRQARELPSVTTRLCPESRAAIWVEIETAAGPLQVINTHLGLGKRERLMQAELLAGEQWLGAVAAGDPLVLLGDFNSLPGSRPFKVLTRGLRDIRTLLTPSPRLSTYPTRLPFLAVDHIFVNGCVRANSATVVRNESTRIASDHFPLLADIQL